VFIALLFFFKSQSSYKSEQAGLSYGNEKVGVIVSDDRDGDGIANWEEALWGTDPTKAETTPGIKDSDAVAKLKSTTEQTGAIKTPEVLTKTDKFSQELFATVVALNQAGPVDQSTIDKVSDSLVNQIQDQSTRKVYLLSDLTLVPDTESSIKEYNTTIGSLFNKFKTGNSITSVLQEFAESGETPDSSILTKLEPIVSKMNSLISLIVKMKVPTSLSTYHLAVINGLEVTSENLVDIQLFDTDTIVAMGAISKYQENVDSLQTAADNLTNILKQKLNN
jgi:hypothetical protein